jgi:hypothetical protein
MKEIYQIFTSIVEKIKLWQHDHLDYAYPYDKNFDGFQFDAKCRYCDYVALQDSNGDWFHGSTKLTPHAMKDIERIEAIAQEIGLIFDNGYTSPTFGMMNQLREKLEAYGAEREQAGRDMAVDYMFKELPISMRPTEAILQEARSNQTKV